MGRPLTPRRPRPPGPAAAQSPRARPHGGRAPRGRRAGAEHQGPDAAGRQRVGRPFYPERGLRVEGPSGSIPMISAVSRGTPLDEPAARPPRRCAGERVRLGSPPIADRDDIFVVGRLDAPDAGPERRAWSMSVQKAASGSLPPSDATRLTGIGKTARRAACEASKPLRSRPATAPAPRSVADCREKHGRSGGSWRRVSGAPCYRRASSTRLAL